MNKITFPPLPTPIGVHESLKNVLKATISEHPFYLASLIIFACAIIHTLFAHQITHLAHVLSVKWDAKHSSKEDKAKYNFGIEILHFLGEVEIIFAIWVIPLLIVITTFWDWKLAVHYIESVSLNEPLFVVVIMVLASTKPIINFAGWCLKQIAKLFNERISAWWLIILTLCPILGSFITEPGAMTLGALLLKRQFYAHKPSKMLSYATLGLLFVNISIGGVLTNFAAPPVLMVAKKWDWSNSFMFFHFGIKSIVAIVISNLVYFFVFMKQLNGLEKTKSVSQENHHDVPTPIWVTAVHVLFLFAIVFFSHYSMVLIGLLFLFIAFHQATDPYQDTLQLRGPILVGAFLSGLVIHGSLQGWWIEPVITRLTVIPAMAVATVLTSFNDNALITYLSSLIPDLSSALKYAIMSGAVAGGGLTVIANAPNPAGQFLLKDHFEDGVAPLNLFLAALFPTLVILGISIALVSFN